MAIALRNPGSTLPRRALDRIAWPLVRERLARLARNILIGWIGLNALTWAPAVDANGRCNCPFCEPLSLSAPGAVTGGLR